MPSPVVSIVGHSGSGKTTFLEKLLKELSSRGYQVATIKRVHKEIHFDEPGKDSWRHINTGSRAVVVSAPNEMVLIKPFSSSLADSIRLLGDDYDIILTEGFKSDHAPKIEVHRRQVGPPLSGLGKLFAIVTDEPLETKVRQFPTDNTAAVADLLENGFIKPQQQRLSLYVNGGLLSLRSFPRRIITNVLLAMVTNLKGVGKINRLEVWWRRPS
jgi:molybdopterin-guanine dinucleotide biosynthesis protein B